MTTSATVKILAIYGSLRAGSSNHAILRHLAALVSVDIEYTIYDDLAQIPPFDPGLDNNNPPAPVAALRQLLADANGIVICTPEYAFGVPGQLKTCSTGWYPAARLWISRFV